jgi:hypothetical protein
METAKGICRDIIGGIISAKLEVMEKIMKDFNHNIRHPGRDLNSRLPNTKPRR